VSKIVLCGVRQLFCAVNARVARASRGDYGKRIKEVRAMVGYFPYLDLPGNEHYDLSTVPSGLA
jgi:hypothetical protein